MPSSSSNYSSQSTQMVPGMMGAYDQLLKLNMGNYQNVLSAYNQGQANLSNRLNQIEPGYNRLGQQVMRTLGLGGGGWGVAAPAARDIQGTLQGELGRADQAAINSGLGNTTVRLNQRSQAASNAARAYGDLGAKLANTAAGYLSQIGLAGQQARMQGLGMQTGLYQHGMSTLGAYQFRNTAGDLTGHFGAGGGSSASWDPYPGQGGGGSRGSSMGGLGNLFADPVHWGDEWLGYNPYGASARADAYYGGQGSGMAPPQGGDTGVAPSPAETMPSPLGDE